MCTLEGVEPELETESEYISEQLKSLIVPIDSVIQNPANTRGHNERNIGAIANSLKAYSQRKPIVVNSRTNMIEAGNGMHMAAMQLGWKHIAAVFVDDDDYMAKGFEISDNRTSDLSEMELPVLKDAIEFLDTGEYELEKMIGYQNHDIEMLMTQVHQEEDNLDINLDEKEINEKDLIQCPKCGLKFKK